MRYVMTMLWLFLLLKFILGFGQKLRCLCIENFSVFESEIIKIFQRSKSNKMVRQKQTVISPRKDAEIKTEMQRINQKFEKDKKELELAKREYSTEFVMTMAGEFCNLLPMEVLNMRLVDFIKKMEEQEDGEDEEEPMANRTMVIEHKTPTTTIPHPSYYKSMKMTDGLHLKVPSCITPRIHGKVQKPRASRFGEILFSVHGTPVMNTVTAANLLEAKKCDAIVQNLLHQEDTMMTPETRKIISKLKELVQKRAGNDSD